MTQVFAWPIPMYLSGSVMSKTGFTLWIGLACVWAVVAACVITLLPPGEAFLTKRTSKQTLPPVQLEPVIVRDETENPVSRAVGSAPNTTSNDPTPESVPAAATSFLQDRRQQYTQSTGLTNGSSGTGADPGSQSGTVPVAAADFLQARRQQQRQHLSEQPPQLQQRAYTDRDGFVSQEAEL